MPIRRASDRERGRREEQEEDDLDRPDGSATPRGPVRAAGVQRRHASRGLQELDDDRLDLVGRPKPKIWP